MRNTAIEKYLNRKMRPRYLGPLVVVSRNHSGAYIVAELNGAVFDRPVAVFRLIPYLARKNPIQFNLADLDAHENWICKLEHTEESYEEEGLAVEEDDN